MILNQAEYDSEIKSEFELESWNHRSENGKGSWWESFQFPYPTDVECESQGFGSTWECGGKLTGSLGLWSLIRALPTIWLESFQVPPKRKSREENRGGAGKGLKSTAKLNFSLTSGPPATLLKLQWTAEKTKTFKEKQRYSLGYNWHSDHWRQFMLSR